MEGSTRCLEDNSMISFSSICTWECILYIVLISSSPSLSAQLPMSFTLRSFKLEVDVHLTVRQFAVCEFCDSIGSEVWIFCCQSMSWSFRFFFFFSECISKCIFYFLAYSDPTDKQRVCWGFTVLWLKFLFFWAMMLC